MNDATRILRAYRRHPHDDLIGEWSLRGVDLRDLQDLFGETGEMYDSYPVRREHVPALERATGELLDLDNYDYFVEAEAG